MEDACVPDFQLPRNLLCAIEDADGDPPQRRWISALPGIVDELARRWSLEVGRPSQPGGAASWSPRHATRAVRADLPRSAEHRVLLCTDLHAGNVLRAEREPWLIIEPKPYVGDPAYDALQHMLNCTERLTADPSGFARRMAALLDLDPQRLRQWLFACCMQESLDQPHLRSVATALAP